MIRRGSSPCMLYIAKNIFCAVGSNMSDRNFLWNRIYTRSILKSDKKLATGGSSKRSQNNDCTSSSLQKKYQGRVAACPTHLCDSINSRYSFFIFTPETVLSISLFLKNWTQGVPMMSAASAISGSSSISISTK